MEKLMKDTLSKLKEQKKIWISPKHPMYFEPLEDRILYCSGVFHFVLISNQGSPLSNFELNRLVKAGLELGNEDMAFVIKHANKGKEIVKDLLQILNTETKQYIFLLDLLQVGLEIKTDSEIHREYFDMYCSLFKISDYALKYLKEFIKAVSKQDVEKAVHVYETMVQYKMELSMSQLKYYIPDLDYSNDIEPDILKNKISHTLVDYCEIRSDIVVGQGKTLIIKSAMINMYGKIIVDGGTLIIEDSVLLRKWGDFDTLIWVKSFSHIEIRRVRAYLDNQSSLVDQENGNLLVEDSFIFESNIKSAIRFWGNKAMISGSYFEGCYAQDGGAAIRIDSGDARITHCKFKYCRADYGGAIFVVEPTKITSCSFEQCHARKYGYSIYYIGNIQNNVVRCVCSTGIPRPEEVVQYIGPNCKFEVKGEVWIRYSTIFDQRLYVGIDDILNISNANIYLSSEAKIEGRLNIADSTVAPLRFRGKDLFDISNARKSTFSNVIFDGKMKVGIFRATGTKMIMDHCHFKNTNHVRAIYDPLDLEITDSIFSYCDGGGIYMNSGKVKNCLFVNCRSDKGAGIDIKGSYAMVKNCRFVRCVAQIDGGGIRSFGNNLLASITFEECKPNAIGR